MPPEELQKHLDDLIKYVRELELAIDRLVINHQIRHEKLLLDLKAIQLN